jgi:hypothetical protein
MRFELDVEVAPKQPAEVAQMTEVLTHALFALALVLIAWKVVGTV